MVTVLLDRGAHLNAVTKVNRTVVFCYWSMLLGPKFRKTHYAVKLLNTLKSGLVAQILSNIHVQPVRKRELEICCSQRGACMSEIDRLKRHVIFSTTERKVHGCVLSFKSINLDNTIIDLV